MSVVDNPFLIKLENAFESRNFIVFVLEFCSGGELFQQLKKVGKMNEEQAKFYFSEICLGMLYLHSLGVAYRDVKPENILLDIDGHIRIADFGLSKPNMISGEQAYSFCGSPEYMAPEMLLKQGHTVQVDHYCMGVLLYELITGLPPFYSKDINKIYNSILNDKITFPPDVRLSSDLKNLLNQLLEKQPVNRIGANGGLGEILSHPWFSNINLVDLLKKKIKPPFLPDQLSFHQLKQDYSNGEVETLDKLLGKRGIQKEFRVFETFYFDQIQVMDIEEEQKKFKKIYESQVANVTNSLTRIFNSKKTSFELNLESLKAQNQILRRIETQGASKIQIRRTQLDTVSTKRVNRSQLTIQKSPKLLQKYF